MKKKSAIIALLLAGIMSFGVVGTAACNKRGGEHKHTWSEYKSDGAEGHHRTTTCEGHEPIDEKISEHDKGDVCGKCGYDSTSGNNGDTEKTVEVKFMNGSTVVETKSVEKGQKVSAPTLTSNDGKYFGGWYDNAACTGNAYDFSTPISGTKTFYVKWIELDANITYSYAGEETVAFEWNDTNASKASVAYKLSSETSYTNVDDELIRGVDADTVRVDVLGLKGNESYDFKITTSAGADMEVNQMHISAYDRSGYAHFNYSDGVGAYNDDGTLKKNAIVLYVTDENKNTVSLTYGGTTVTGIGNILNSVGQDVGGGKTSNGGTANSNQGIIKKLGEANIPLVVRFIGCVSDSGLYKAAKFDASSTPKIDGLTIYDSTGKGGTEGDNGHMARIKSGKDITLEGIGEDAVIDGWGFHYMAESSSPNLGKSFEVRNLTFINTPEDAIGMEGVQASKDVSADLSASVERCWIHNNEFYGPDIGSPAESDKSEGDGSCDFKRGQYFTCSYNYFEGCHKTNLVGSADYSLQFNLTYHHNYWKLCKARGPLARRANIHMYNNVFEGQTDYAMNTRADAYIFSEYNLFYMCKSPQAVEGGAIKSYNDSISSYLTNKGSLGTVVTDKSQIVPNNCKFAARNIKYDKFDTDSNLSYIPTGDYQLQTNVTEARKVIAARAGVRQRDYKLPSDITLADLSYVPSGVTPTKVTTYPSEVAPGKINKVPYAFTIDRSATVTVSCGDGVLVNEAGECLMSGSGSVNLEPGTYMIQAVTFQPGDSKKVTNGTFKELTISSVKFEEYESEEFNAKLLADYNTKAGAIDVDTIVYDNASYRLIVNAKNAYDILSPELKAQVTVPYTTVTAALTQYINLGKAEVEGLIAAIGTVNENSGTAISKARSAYQALTNIAPDVTVSNYSTLTAAEAAYEEFKVQGLNKQISELPATSTATTEEALNELLEKYEAVKVMYEDLDEDQKKQVTNYTKVTEGIAALEKALKPYEVKAMIAELPEKTEADYYAKVKQLKAAYEALDASGKALITEDEKAAYDVAVEYASKVVNVTFLDGKPSNDVVKSTGAKQSAKKTKFTVNAYSTTEQLATGLKFESSTELTLTLATKMTVSFYLLDSTAANTVAVNGTAVELKQVGGDNVATVTLEAGTYKITRAKSENSLYFMTLIPA